MYLHDDTKKNTSLETLAYFLTLYTCVHSCILEREREREIDKIILYYTGIKI